jgi:hypothetical protein
MIESNCVPVLTPSVVVCLSGFCRICVAYNAMHSAERDG